MMYSSEYIEELFFARMFIGIEIVSYIFIAVALLHIFKTLKITPSLAFIPIYNKYRLFEEYKGRVYTNNRRGILFIVTKILPYFLFVWFTILSEIGDELIIGGILIIIAFICLANSILEIILYFPLLMTAKMKIFFVAIFIFSKVMWFFIFYNSVVGLLLFIVSLLSFTVEIFILTIAIKSNEDVKEGKYHVVEKIDKNNNKELYKLKVLLRNGLIFETKEKALARETIEIEEKVGWIKLPKE